MSRVSRTTEERFWAKVDKTETCWLWVAHNRRDGYGWFFYNKRQGPAHRYAYELLVGPIATGLVLDHLCRVRNCVNPAHLEVVTVGENIRRGLKGAMVTACVHGHEYTPETTNRHRNGCRYCRICDRERKRAEGHPSAEYLRAYRARRKAEGRPV